MPLGLVTACRLAGSPTRVSPLAVNATTDGVRRLPSWLGMTVDVAAFHHRDDAVGRPQVDADDLFTFRHDDLLSIVQVAAVPAGIGPRGRLAYDPNLKQRECHCPGPGAAISSKIPMGSKLRIGNNFLREA